MKRAARHHRSVIWESSRAETGSSNPRDIARGFLLLTLATSIDALAVGLSFAFMEVGIPLACSVIGTVAFVAATAGFLLGRKAGRSAGRWAGALGGLVLVAISLRILLFHLL
jgi:putative Mn2+ efflux pump MntP